VIYNDTGSLYASSLCQALEALHETEDLTSILTHVGHLVAYQQSVVGTPEDSPVFQQQPSVTSQLNKRLFLRSKPSLLP
jgi:hypothetical protein